jgi:hypothetical protein
VCFSTTNSIHVLNLQGDGQTERVVSGKFFGQKVAVAGETASSAALLPRSLSLLGYNHEILTVLSDFGPEKGCFLFAVNIGPNNGGQRCLLQHRLRSTEQLFACHNDKYLYCGTLSARGSFGHNEWLIQGFNLRDSSKVTVEPVQLEHFAGSDTGMSVTFIIHDDHFYALSNQTSHESEEVNWTSYYHCISFALDSSDPDTRIKAIYRRQDNEGPINDAFTDLGFQVDHETGELLIVECRKEWLQGRGRAIRTYYVQSWDRALPYTKDWDAENSVDPTEQISNTITPKDNAKFEKEPHPRVAKYTHKEFETDDLEGAREYLRAKTKWNGYDFNNQCYVDLVVDEVDDEGSWRKKERIRLRVACRVPASPIHWIGDRPEGVGQLDYEVLPRFKDRDGKYVQDSEDAWRSSEVSLWPGHGEDVPKDLDEILCPNGKAGEVKAKIGEEGIVYMVGPTGHCGGRGEGDERALVFLGFESGWGFEGMKRMNGELAIPRKKECIDNAMMESGSGEKRRACGQPDNPEIKRQKTEDGAGSEHRTSTPVMATNAKAKAETSVDQKSVAPAPRERLLWMEKARYLTIGRGYWIGGPKSDIDQDLKAEMPQL